MARSCVQLTSSERAAMIATAIKAGKLTMHTSYSQLRKVKSKKVKVFIMNNVFDYL